MTNQITLKCDGCEITFTPFGGHLISYKSNNKEILFMSPYSKMDGSKPIRGGVPICWPWFGKIRDPSHGVARISVFNVDVQKAEKDQIYVELSFEHDEMKIIEKITANSK